MSAKIEGHAEELLKGKNFCNVATLRSDGSVHAAPVWVDVQDGLPTLNTAEGRAWPRNLERDPRVTLTVQNMDEPLRVRHDPRTRRRAHPRGRRRAHRRARDEVPRPGHLPLSPARRTARDHPRRARVRAHLRSLRRTGARPRGWTVGRAGGPEQSPPPRRPARLGAQPLIAQHELSPRARAHHARGVRVAAAAGVAFGGDQHVLAERGQMMAAESGSDTSRACDSPRGAPSTMGPAEGARAWPHCGPSRRPPSWWSAWASRSPSPRRSGSGAPPPPPRRAPARTADRRCCPASPSRRGCGA